MKLENLKDSSCFDVVRRCVTKYDFGYTDQNKWLGYGGIRASKTEYKRAIKLTKEDILKFEKLNNLIGCIVNFRIGKKIYKATIVAVSLPDDKITVYPTGEIQEATGKEFVNKYCSYPFAFNLAIEGRMNFWSSRIDKIDFSEIIKQSVTYFKYKNWESIPDNFI